MGTIPRTISKITIEKLIERGHLAEFVTNGRQLRQDVQPPEPQQPLDNINVVSGGTWEGGDSQLVHKRHTRASRAYIEHIQPTSYPPTDTLDRKSVV